MSFEMLQNGSSILPANSSNIYEDEISRYRHSSSTTQSSASSSSSSLENIIYQVPKSNECIYIETKSCVDQLIPAAARLILSQSPKNRFDLVEEDRSDADAGSRECTTNGGRGFSSDSDHAVRNARVEYEEDFLDDAPSLDFGLQVIHEETESQMESDSDQELDGCEDTIRQRKSSPHTKSHNNEALSKIDLIPDYTTSWLRGGSSSSPDSDTHDKSGNDKSMPDEIIMKHIRVPSDWDPDILLKRIYKVTEPKVNNGGNGGANVGMEGHMQILSGNNRKKETFWNAWKKKFCTATGGKLACYEKDDCADLFQCVNLVGGKVDFLDPIEFIDQEKGKAMVNRILGVDDGKGHYHVFQCSSVGEANRWIETLQEQAAAQKTFVTPILSNPSLYRDIILVDFGSINVRAGVLTHQPTLPALFFNSVMSENEESGHKIYGNDVYLPSNRKKAKIKFPFECTSKMCQNTVDLSALKGFLQKIFTDLRITPNNFRLILTLPRRVDKKCRENILKFLFYDFQLRSVLMCHQSVISFWAHSAENGIIVDIGERCDIVPVSQGFVLSQAWGRAPFGGHVLKHSLRQSLGPQENGLYLSTPVENLVLRFISENFVCVPNNGNAIGQRKLSQDSQEIVVEMDLRDVLPFSNLIGVNQEVLKSVAEGFFDPGLYGLDCDSLQKILHKSILDTGVDIRKEMSKNIFLVGGCTLIPGFPERLESELTKLCPPHLKPTIQVSPYRYHSSFIGASVLAGTEAYEKSLLQRSDYDGGPGPAHWLI